MNLLDLQVDRIALQRHSRMPGVGTTSTFRTNQTPPSGDAVSRPLKSNSAIGRAQTLSRTTRL